MNIRRRAISATLAITLIGIAPAWSQSLLKTLDPDNDGTVDLTEAKTAAGKLTSSTAIMMAPSIDANFAVGSMPRISPPRIPTTTELWTRMNFWRSSKSASRLPIPTMTERLTPRSSEVLRAGRSCDS